MWLLLQSSQQPLCVTDLTLQVEKQRCSGLAEDAGGLLNWFESYLL